MRKWAATLLAAAVVFCGCAGQGDKEAERLLADALKAASERGDALKGHIRVTVSDQTVLRADSVYYDPDHVLEEAGSLEAPKLESALIGLDGLLTSARRVTVDRPQGRGGETVLEVTMEPEKVKERVRAYFADNRRWLQQKFGRASAAGTEPDGPGRTQMESEERKWDELLRDLDAGAVYRLVIDSKDRHIERLDADMVLRYKKDGRMVEEHITALYETVRNSGSSGG